jgi:presenilin-like A22 family membrane protease
MTRAFCVKRVHKHRHRSEGLTDGTEGKGIIAPLGLAILFVATQVLAAAVAPSFQAEGFETFEDPGDPANIAYLFAVIVTFTVIILVIARYREDIIKYIILLFFFLASLSIFEALLFLVAPSGATVGALVIAVVMLVLLIAYPEWYVIDTFGIFLAGGIAALFAISLSVELIIIFLCALAIYDAISVHKTKHMVTLAETLTSSHLPLLLMVPKNATFSYRRLESIGRARDAVYMGLGDFIIPGWLIAYASLEHGTVGFAATLVGALAGYAVLMVLVARGPQPGLPYLNGGAIAGYALTHFA